MNGDKVLLTVAIVAIIIAFVSAGVTYFSVASLMTKISGLATSEGYANLTVKTGANINFTTFDLNWSEGQVNDGETYAVLNTADGTVTNGNWTAVDGGLILENIGNVNVTLDLQSGKSPATFIGGSNPGYMWNISTSEANSCVNVTYDVPYLSNITGFGNFVTVSDSALYRVCDIFEYRAAADTIEIDLNLSISIDSLKGALTDVITATATAI